MPMTDHVNVRLNSLHVAILVDDLVLLFHQVFQNENDFMMMLRMLKFFILEVLYIVLSSQLQIRKLGLVFNFSYMYVFG